MVLEATMICLDNSDWSRNGDFTPSRLDAQYDTANLLGGTKTQSNPENAVGLLTMANKRVTVAIAPTSDMGAFLQALHNIPCAGRSDFIRSIQTAQLALKHRLNRNQRQRIVVFVCSPIDATEKQMETIGKSLKKNNISLDIISFGQVIENSPLLKKLYATVNSNDTSHFLEVTNSSTPLTRQVMQSSLVMDETGPRTSGEVDEFGVDPNADPELYLALRLSLEDERARARRAQNQAQAPVDMQNGQIALTSASEEVLERAPNTITHVIESGDAAGVIVSEMPDISADNVDEGKPPSVEDIMAMDIDEELRQALLLSLKEYVGTEDPNDQTTSQLEKASTPDEEQTMADAAGPPEVEILPAEQPASVEDMSLPRPVKPTADDASNAEFKTPRSESSDTSPDK